MALESKLILKGHSKENKGINVLDCHYGIVRKTDDLGRPFSDAKAGMIELSLISGDDPDLINWIFALEAIEGEIVFYNKRTNNAVSKVKFKDAYIVNYEFYYSSFDSEVLKITISAGVITLGNYTHHNTWK